MKNETDFLNALTELSQRYRIGIAGSPILFEMETGSSGDDDRAYHCDEQSSLSFD
jgi:hypothetical protein